MAKYIIEIETKEDESIKQIEIMLDVGSEHCGVELVGYDVKKINKENWVVK